MAVLSAVPVPRLECVLSPLSTVIAGIETALHIFVLTLSILGTVRSLVDDVDLDVWCSIFPLLPSPPPCRDSAFTNCSSRSFTNSGGEWPGRAWELRGNLVHKRRQTALGPSKNFWELRVLPLYLVGGGFMSVWVEGFQMIPENGH